MSGDLDVRDLSVRDLFVQDLNVCESVTGPSAYVVTGSDPLFPSFVQNIDALGALQSLVRWFGHLVRMLPWHWSNDSWHLTFDIGQLA